MREMFRKYPDELDYLFDRYIGEMNDVADTIVEKLYFLRKVKGHLKLILKNEVPEDFQTRHLDKALKGIRSLDLLVKGKELKFYFRNTSIYQFLCEMEYLRAYCKYRSLTIETIELLFNPTYSAGDPFQPTEYEWIDVKHSLQITRLFSGTLSSEFVLKYPELDIIREKSGTYNSVYKLFSEIQAIREIREFKTKEELFIRLNNMNDSKVHVTPNLFRRRDDEVIN